MPSRRETFPILCRGGLVTDQAPVQLGINNPGAAQRLVNFEPSIQGGYRRVNGYQKWDSQEVPAVNPASQILGVCFFNGSVLAAREGDVYESNGAGWSSIATGRTQTTKQRYSQFNFSGTRKIIATDGVNFPYTWDGTNFTNLSSAALEGASMAVAFKNHMFYAVGSSLIFSVPFLEDDLTVADGSGEIKVAGTITGIIVFRNQLFVFTEETIDAISGSSLLDFQKTSVAEGTGCIAIDTIQEVAGDVAFLSSDGLRLLGATDRDGDFSNQIASKAIQTNFDDFHDEYQQFSSIVIREKSQYRVFGWLDGRDADLTKGFVGTQFESQNPLSFNWGELIGFKVYSSYSQVFNGEEFIVFCSDTGFIYRMDRGSSFDGEPIPSSYWTPYISFSDPIFRKTLYSSYLYTAPEGNIVGSLTLNFDFNQRVRPQPPTRDINAAGGGALFGDAIFGSSFFVEPPTSVIRNNLIGSGQNCAFQYTFEGGSPFILDTIMVEYATEDRS